MNVISIISACLGLILSIASVITIIKTKTMKVNDINEGVKALLRSEILKYYFKHKEENKIYQYERECIDRLYDAYKALGGNSFIDDVYSEIREWEVIN